jgi:hypothetical protein
MKGSRRSSTMKKSRDSSKPNRARVPLAQVDTSAQSERQLSMRMDNSSDVSDLQEVALFDFGESEFELMHVTVTIHSLTGLLSDRSSIKKRAMDALTPRSKRSHDTFPEGTASSSLSSSSYGTRNYVDRGKIPTLAIATFGRNVTSSETSIKTHLPSQPLGQPTSSFGYVNRYIAQWREPKPTVLLEKGEVDGVSSFTFLRVMMRETMDLGEEVQANTAMSRYVHETIDIEINLSRGKEIILLGVASLAITGDEEGPAQISLPAKPVVFKGKKAVLSNSAYLKNGRNRLFKKKLKRASFPSDPKRTFFLDENATLSVSVKITPQESIDDARARKQAREIRRQMNLEKKYQDENNSIVCEEQSASFKSPKSDFLGNHRQAPKPKTPTFLQKSFFCGSCNGGNNEVEVQESTSGSSLGDDESQDYTSSSSDFEQVVEKMYGYSLASSVLSSVSESESSSSDESEDPRVHLNRNIVVRKEVVVAHRKKSRRSKRNH